jgi:hypothetical protein
VRGGVACAILLNGYEKRLVIFEKVGKKRENNFGKEDISEIPIGYVEIGSREINLNKKNSSS